MKPFSAVAAAALAASFPLALPAAPGDRDTMVREDKSTFEDDASWIYNDLAKATADAKAAGKPLFVVLRCIP